ncbi:MAG: IS1 family transposase [Oscillospiraceae bacterium]|nr:IS1 family transposase [Oscillospiraceae bacterium]
MNKKIMCPHCGKTERQIKRGRTLSGSQKYFCKDCLRVYTPNPKRREYSDEIKKQAIKLYLEGNSGLAVGRILGISKNLCLYWVKKYSKKLKPKKVFNERVEVIEMNEQYDFLNLKK